MNQILKMTHENIKLLWCDPPPPLQHLLLATFVSNNQHTCVDTQNCFKFQIVQRDTKNLSWMLWIRNEYPFFIFPFTECLTGGVWLRRRLCRNVFLPYSNDRLTLPFTQISPDMLKLGPTRLQPVSPSVETFKAQGDGRQTENLHQ